MRLIGLSGLKTSGKDTVCGLISEFEPDVKRVGFADKLKIMAAMALGFEDDPEVLIALMNKCKENWTLRLCFAGGDEEQFNRLTGREYLQWFGSNGRKVFGNTFWIDQVLPLPSADRRPDIREQDNYAGLIARYPGAAIVCITDVRYENEARRVKDLGGEIWEIVRPGLESDGHASEAGLPRELIDVTIPNDGTLQQLRALVACSL
jgi:hypothetical protein